ncbi:MAG TPA: adenylate/guanylate cyclase domain-containing protein [Candidatus Ozemobacteraceae bacterium]|nr:adenylate/guanylate cyclase domain-containing protein [Candidatus Ozemobacteraceae bacterium]
MLLFVFLLALPFAAINAGASFLTSRREAWNDRELVGDVRLQLEALANSAPFEPLFERAAARLQTRMTGQDPDGETPSARALRFEQDLAAHLGRHGPTYDLWLFEDEAVETGDRVPRVLLASASRSIPQRAAATAFACLAHFALRPTLSESAVSRGRKLVISLFGPGQNARHLAVVQRGVMTQVIHDRVPSYLIWNGTVLPDGRRRGFFLLFRNTASLRETGMRAALRAHQRRGGFPAGFVRILRTDVPDLLHHDLSRSPAFRSWRTGLRPHAQYSRWELNGTPWDLSLADGRLFTRNLPGGTHLAVLMMPTPGSARSLPIPLFLLNVIVFGGGLLVLTRGLLLGSWPNLPLGVKFSSLFGISALLPVSLLLIGSLAFISESGNAARNAVSTRIRSVLERIDSAKERLSGTFQAAFLRMIQDPRLREALARDGIQASSLPDQIRAYFRDGRHEDQLVFVALIDIQGRMRFVPGKGYTTHDLEGAMRFCRTGLLQALRKRHRAQAGPDSLGPDPLSEEDRAFVTGYEGATGNELAIEMEQARTLPFDYPIRRSTANLLFDYLAIDGIDTCAVIIGWNADDLARRILLNGLAEIREQLPNGIPTAFRIAHGRLAPLVPPSRHDPPELVAGIRRIAMRAEQRNGPVVETTSESAFVALPSRAFKGVILAATEALDGIRAQERRRMILAGGLAGLCMLIVLLAGRLSAKRMLSPILRLREALERVQRGDLAMRLAEDRPDELGRLAAAFGSMVAGLRERRQLASLVSDQAIATLESAEDPGMAMTAGTVEGAVLTSDIRGFTPLCESRPPAEVVALLNRHFAVMAPLITAAGGRIDKFIGDAIQAVFVESPGAEPAAARAVSAGIAMLHALEGINRERETAGLLPYRAGVGIAGGRLLTGAIGHPSTRLDFALLGPAISRAADLEALTKLVPDHPIAIDASLAPRLGRFADLIVPLPGHENNIYSIIISENRTTPSREPPGPVDRPALPDPAGDAQGPASSLPSDRSKPGFSSIGAFLMGLAGLALPVIALLGAMDGRVNGSLDRAIRETRERQEITLAKLRVTSPIIHLLEDRLEVLSNRIAAVFQNSDPQTGAAERQAACREALSELSRLSFPPARAGVLYRSPLLPPASWPLELVTGTDASTTADVVRNLLAHTTCSFAGQARQGLRDPTPDLPGLLGRSIAVSNLENNATNRVIPIVRDTANGWFYWRPLLIPPQIPPDSLATSAVGLSPGPEASLPVQGMLLLSIPRRLGDEESPALLLELLRSPGQEIAIGTASPGSLLSTKGFPRGLMDVAPGLHQVKGDRIVVSRSEVRIGGRWLPLSLATRIEPPPSAGAPLEAALVIAFLGLAAVWYQTVFRRRALATTLFGQLLAGFLAAAVLPFSAILAGTARFTAEDLETRTRVERLDLAQMVDELDRRHLLLYPFAWDRIARISHHPKLVRSVIRPRPPEARRKADPALEAILSSLKQASKKGAAPYFTNRIILSTPDGWRYEQGTSPNAAHQADMFTFYLTTIAQLMFDSVGDAPGRTTPDETLGDAVKREMAVEGGFSIFRSVFSPEVSYDMLYSPVSNVLLPGGNGVVTISNHLLPDIIRPRGFISWVWNASWAEKTALNRIIHGKPSRFALFGCQAQHAASMIRADLGGSLPAIAGVARWTQAGNMPMSVRLGTGSGGLLVEARPGVFNPRLILAGAAAEAPLLAASRRIGQDLLLWLAAGILATLLLAWRSASGLVTPIRELEAGMREIAAGRYETRIGNCRNDEIGDLQRSFDRMARSLQERELIRSMMSNEARRSASDGSNAEPSRRSEAIIVMTGVPGFQSIADALSPEELFGRLTRQTARLCDLFITAGGDVDKVIGEKLLVVFQGRSAEETAARLVHALQQLAGSPDASDELPFPVAAGIACGPVISGVIGSGARKDHTVIGDTVNTAARLLGQADRVPGTPAILVSAAVRELLPVGTRCELLGNIAIKGKSAPLAVFHLLPAALRQES